MTVKDVVSPLFSSFAQWFGYAVFAIAWIVVLFAFFRALLDARPQSVTRARKPVRRLARILVFPMTGTGRYDAVMAPVSSPERRSHGSLQP
jgi:hypothetical protein